MRLPLAVDVVDGCRILNVMPVKQDRQQGSGAARKRKPAAKRSAARPAKSRPSRKAAARSAAAPPRTAGVSGTSRRGGSSLDEAAHAFNSALAAFVEAAERLRELVSNGLRVSSELAADAAPTLERAGELFKQEMRELLGDVTPDDDAVRRAARHTIAEQAWEQRLGDLLETSDVEALLSVSRQQVSALAKADRLIVLKKDGRHRFPAWQFAGTDAQQRACLAKAHREFVGTAGYSPWTAASWFLSEHGSLGDQDPVAFLRTGGACDDVLTAARRDAARAAQ
jgi:hypothetical protein